MSETQFLITTGAEIAGGVSAREYNRLLQLPRDRELEGDLLDRANSARRWYEEQGKPFVASRKLEIKCIGGRASLTADAIVVDAAGTEARPINEVILNSMVLARRLKAGEAHALIILAASAGPEVSDEISKHWAEGRPDEAFFLDRFAVGVTERLIFWASAALCRASESSHETVLPHLSPGCGNWDFADQHKLMGLLSNSGPRLGPLELLDSGALHPQHSVLAALGVTHKNFASTPAFLCRSCELTPCAFRRAPYAGEAFGLMEIQ